MISARAGLRLFITFLLGLWVTIGQAQDFPTYQTTTNILIINQDALFSQTVLGQDILNLEQQDRDALIEEGRRIGADFVSEELELTTLRDTLSADEFRALATAFDEKVEKARAEQEANDSTLIANIEARRRSFFQIIAPALAGLMQKYGAAAIIDRRSVLLFDRNLDITSEAIELLDNAYRENPDMLNLIGPENE